MRIRWTRSHSPSLCLFIALLLVGVVAPGTHRACAAAVDYELLHSFGFTNLIGRSPEAALTLGRDGRLYGTARLGGRGNRGTVYTIRPDGLGFLVIHNFYGTNGSLPTAEVVDGPEGKLYGTTFQGGATDKGVAYRIAKDGTEFELLHEFGADESDGANPVGNLLVGRDGWIYGTCFAGGTTNAGTIFRLRPDGTDYSTLRQLTAEDGSAIQAGLIEARDGRLYGTASRGGADDLGTVFGLNTDGSDFAVVHEFDGTDGTSPVANLLEGSDGALYGSTREGGVSGFGTLFRVSGRDRRFAVLWDFWGGGWDGFRPFCALVEGSDGALYGTTAGGGTAEGGILFRINKDGSAYEILRSFGTMFVDGANPFCGLTRIAGDRLVGTTFAGGGSGGGSMFTVREDGSDYGVLWSFSISGGDGVNARTELIEGSDGALYGTTDAGGYYGLGTIYRMQKDGGGFAILHDFMGTNSEGRGPISALIEGRDGFLYGTTSGEETNGNTLITGTLFKLAKDGTQFTNLHAFTSAVNRINMDGIRPVGAPLEGQDGFLYGFTGASGTNGFGTLYKIAADGSAFEVIYQLNRTNGGFAGASPIQGSDGLLYCVASGSPQRTNGTVFRVSTNGTDLLVLRNFNGGDGSVPAAKLLEASDGRIYGTTTNGGLASRGTIFRVEKDGSHFTILRSFRGGTRDGANPFSSLIEGEDGELYGTTRNGGFRDRGMIFRIGKDGLRYAALHHFFDSDPIGGRSASALWQSADGAFYGTTPIGGDLGQGLIFRVTKRFPYLETALSPYGFTFSFNGVTNQPYQLQRSTNLTEWTTLETITLSEPYFLFEDTNAPSGAAFYRMLPTAQ
ncbi:MAG: hypothetical protein IPK15_05715 [Verrucomicrobia bacterium]|nr:hypothetical protein [Verrucomicrobiota bacterium]